MMRSPHSNHSNLGSNVHHKRLSNKHSSDFISVKVADDHTLKLGLKSNGNGNDKTQWNEHWNDWISRCNQFSSCLNKSESISRLMTHSSFIQYVDFCVFFVDVSAKEHLYGYQFVAITGKFEIVKRNAVQRTLKQTDESITEISNALGVIKEESCPLTVDKDKMDKIRIVKYRTLNHNVTEFRRQLLKMKRHGQDRDIDAQLKRLALVRDNINMETGDRMTTCICGGIVTV